MKATPAFWMHAYALVLPSALVYPHSHRTTNIIAHLSLSSTQKNQEKVVREKKIGIIGIYKCTIWKANKDKINGNFSVNIRKILIYSIDKK